MPVATLDTALYIFWFQPYFALQIQHCEIIQRIVTIPPTKHVHVVLIDASSVPKSQFQLGKQLVALWRLHILTNLAVNFRPLLLGNLKFKDVSKDVRFVSTSIHEDLCLIDHQ